MNAEPDFPAIWVMPVALRQLAECGDSELVEELFTLFQTDTAERLERLEGALAQHDFPGVSTEAHTIKGSAVQVGAIRVADYCRQIELEVKRPRPVELMRLMQLLQGSFREVCAALAIRNGKERTQSPF